MKFLKKFSSTTCNLITNNPYKCLLLFSLLFAIAIPGIFKIESDFTYKAWYNDDDPGVAAFNDFEKKFGNDDNIAVFIKSETGAINNKTIRITKEIIERTWEVDEIFRMENIFNFNLIKSENDDLTVTPLIDPDKEIYSDKELETIKKNILNSEPARKYYVGKDLKSFFLRSFLRPAFKVPTDHALVTQNMRKIVNEFRKKYPDHQFILTGSATVVEAFKKGTIDDITFLTPILYTIFMIILWFRFKNISSLVLTFLVITISTMMMFSFMGYSLFTLNTLSAASITILLTVAISDAVHILSSYKYGLTKYATAKDAVYYSLEKNFYPTLLTSLTTAYGFFSFGGALVRPIATMGVSVAGGVILAWIVTYFCLGPLLVILSKKQVTSATTTNNSEDKISKDTKKFVGMLEKYKKSIVLLSLIAGIISLFISSFLVVDMDPVEQFKDDHSMVTGYNTIIEEMGFSTIIYMEIQTNKGEVTQDPSFMNRVDKFQTWLNSREYINSTLSILNILKSVNQSLNNNDEKFYKVPESREAIAQQILFYSLGLPAGQDLSNSMSLDNKSITLNYNWRFASSQDSRKYFKIITDKARNMGLEIQITGKTPLFHELTPYVVQTFFESFIIAFVGITIIMVFALQSFKLGLLALIPNIFPLVIGSAIYYLAGQTVDMGTVIIASVCLGIAVDDSIHFLFEYQKYRKKGHDVRSAIEKIITTTFASLFLTTLLITVGFSSFILGNYIPNIKFGIMVSIILVIALFADFVILPAILLITEKDKK